MTDDPTQARRPTTHGPCLCRIVACTALALLPVHATVHASADGLVASATSPAPTPASTNADASPRIAFWPFTKPHRPPIYESNPCNVTPHPAVARIIVPERGATAYGSGTLIDVRDQFGLVVTNWHVVRDSQGIVEVVFPGGFRSHARPLKVDSNWDLAALVIWRPPIEPVKLATRPPRPGDLLTIHGYGRGQYRIATGRCTTYYAPKMNFPHEMVELDVEARQGDSGGPIFNQTGELAGVLFGAGQGTTLGSFAPRVSNFLASLAPDIGQVKDQAQVAVADRPAPIVEPLNDEYRNGSITRYPSAPWTPVDAANTAKQSENAANRIQLANNTTSPPPAQTESCALSNVTSDGWYDPAKSALALIGLFAIALQLVKLVR
ncbi:MAG: serine protease [Planctomycetes bacterium]|nr:serine protease [Planctomycetota bacterium]